VTFPESLTSIGKAAFLMCTTLKSAILPKSIKQIGPEAFQTCPCEKKVMDTFAKIQSKVSSAITEDEDVSESAFKKLDNAINEVISKKNFTTVKNIIESLKKEKEEIKEKKPATKDECKMIKSSRKRSSITGKGVTKTPFGKK
jgi:uncharacterized radical SAM superfamily Fe-S cluster-containing enzyme